MSCPIGKSKKLTSLNVFKQYCHIPISIRARLLMEETDSMPCKDKRLIISLRSTQKPMIAVKCYFIPRHVQFIPTFKTLLWPVFFTIKYLGNQTSNMKFKNVTNKLLPKLLRQENMSYLTEFVSNKSPGPAIWRKRNSLTSSSSTHV